MSWKAWAARIAGYAGAPFTAGVSAGIGEAVAQGIDSKGAVKDANSQQQAATDQANARLDTAQKTNTNVYNQQRTDYQNLANKPFQNLGTLLGMQIPDVTPLNQNPSGMGAGLHEGTLDQPLTPYNPPAAGGDPTLSQQAHGIIDALRTTATNRLGNFAQTSASGYGAGQPAGGGDTVKVKSPTGRVVLVPRHRLAEAQQQGGQVVS